jgi:C-terminal processing protease CtpA/Prc
LLKIREIRVKLVTEAGLKMNRRNAIAIAVCIAILMVAGILLFVFQPQKPAPHRPVPGRREFVGVGLEMWSDAQRHVIVIGDVIPNSPASEAGITHGTILAKVNGISMAGMPLATCVSLMGGQEGSQVYLELVTPDHTQTNTVALTRRKLQI